MNLIGFEPGPADSAQRVWAHDTADQEGNFVPKPRVIPTVEENPISFGIEIVLS